MSQAFWTADVKKADEEGCWGKYLTEDDPKDIQEGNKEFGGRYKSIRIITEYAYH